MKRLRFFFAAILIVAVSVAFAPSASACATCFGASDSPMAQGMNWGIFSLLAVILSLLIGIAGFFVFLARKSAQVASQSAPEPLSLETNNV